MNDNDEEMSLSEYIRSSSYDKAYIGIDPGFSGAIACIKRHESSNSIEILPMPVEGKEIDVLRIVDWLGKITYCTSPLDFRRIDIFAYIEKVGAYPGQGVVSMFNFGFNAGILHGIFRTLSIPFHIVHPKAWKSMILSGTDKSKEASINYCLRAYPNISLKRTERSRKNDDGIADAICIAEYGRRIEEYGS